MCAGEVHVPQIEEMRILAELRGSEEEALIVRRAGKTVHAQLPGPLPSLHDIRMVVGPMRGIPRVDVLYADVFELDESVRTLGKVDSLAQVPPPDEEALDVRGSSLVLEQETPAILSRGRRRQLGYLDLAAAEQDVVASVDHEAPSGAQRRPRELDDVIPMSIQMKLAMRAVHVDGHRVV
jgi:hypothetical protein